MWKRLLWVLLLLPLLHRPAQAQTPPDTTQPRAIFGHGLITDLHWSGSGRWLAVTTTRGVFLFDQSLPDSVPALLQNHTDTVSTLAFSPDERWLVTGSADETIRVWEIATNTEIATLSAGAWVHDIEFSADGLYMAAVMGRQYPEGGRIWETTRWQDLTLLAGETIWGWHMAPEGVWLITSSGAGLAKADTYEQRIRFEQRVPIPSATFSPAGRWLALAHEGTLSLWDLTTGSLVMTQPSELLPTFSADDRLMSLLSQNIEIEQHTYTFFDLDHAVQRQVSLSIDQPRQLIAETGTFIYGSGSELHLLDIAANTEIILPDSTSEQATFSVSPGGAYIVSIIGDLEDRSRVFLWDTASQQQIALKEVEYVNNIQWLNAEWVLLNLSTEIVLWHAVDGQEFTFPSAPMAAFSAAINGAFLAYTSDNRLLVRSLADQNEPTVLKLPGHAGQILDLALTPDGQQMITTGSDKTVRLWNTITAAETLLIGFQEGIATVIASPDGRYVLGAGADRAIYIWSAQDGALMGSLSGHQQAVTALAFDLEGLTLASAGNSGELITWQFALIRDQLGSNTLITAASIGAIRFEHPGAEYRSLAISPDRRTIAAGGMIPIQAGQTFSGVDLWDTAGQYETIFTGQDYGITGLGFNPDGSVLATSGGDVRFWVVANQEMLSSLPLSFVAEAVYNSGGTRLVAMTNAVTDFGYSWEGAVFAPSDGYRITTFGRDLQMPSEGGGGGSGFWLLPRPVAITPDSTRFATVDAGGLAILWDMPLQDRPLPFYNILAYCEDDPATIPPPLLPTDTLNVVWSWYATEPDLMSDHMLYVDYEVTVDGRRIENWQAYSGLMYRDPVNDNQWTVYWSVPIGTLPAGEHEITFRSTWRQQIFDGVAYFGPDSDIPEETGRCRFTIEDENP